MPTPYEVPANLLIAKVAEELKKKGKITPPDWSRYVKTGVHREKSPTNPDWWYERAAAVLRKVYMKGPIGSSRLAAEFGGKVDRGSKPYHARKGSRSIARHSLQQLEEAGYLEKLQKRGRVISPSGRSMLDKLSREILKELAKENVELAKYC
ncbi:MAG: 30S ribosomal protein S19e [Thermoplasmata archaeon]